MIETVSSLFSGGGLFDKGAEMANKKVLWAVEKDPNPIILYNLNFPHSRILQGDVSKINYSCLEVPDLLHASPSCVNYSQASMGQNKEEKSDVRAAIGTTVAIEQLKPAYFSLENVYDYEYSQAFQVVYNTLSNLGYYIEVHKVNLNDYGVPQNRKRLILLATNLEKRSQVLTLPNEKRAKGWYESIYDLVDGFEVSELTSTQKKCLQYEYYSYLQPNPNNYLPYLLLKRNQVKKKLWGQTEESAAFTVTAQLCTDGKGGNRAKFADILNHEGIKSLSLRALARFQTAPDDYKLTGKNAFDGLVIGNGVPCQFVCDLLSTL